MDDLQARLDRAITEARRGVRAGLGRRYFDVHSCSDPRMPTKDNDDRRSCARRGQCDYFDAEDRALDHYAALVALRARYDECDQFCDALLHVDRVAELDAECARLLGEGA